MSNASSNRLPSLRRRRPPWNLARLAARASSGIKAVERTVEPFAAWWDDQNNEAMLKDGPLWVVLGDSTAQGIGAPAPEQGFVGKAHQMLNEATGQPWRVINLSMSGGRFADAEKVQLPVVKQFDLRPQLMSAVIGSNDLVWRVGTTGVLDDARRFVDRAPDQLVLSRVSEMRKDAKRRGVNAIFDAAGAMGRVSLYNVWDWPTGRGMWASDNFHPNEQAYEVMAQHTFAALMKQLGNPTQS